MKPKRRIIPIFIPNEGCKHECVFCDQRRITGTGTPVSASDISRLISAAISVADAKGAVDAADASPAVKDAAYTMRAADASPAAKDAAYTMRAADTSPEIAFYGGSFTALTEERQEELLHAAQEFLADNRCSSIRVSTRPDCVDAPAVERLKKHGVRTVELGAQSMSDDVLEASGRGHTAADVAKASAVIKAAGLSLILQMMTGLPGDSREKAVETARQFVGLKPDGVRIYPAVVVLGTELYEMWRRGEYEEHKLEDAISICADLCLIFEEASIPVIRLGLNPSDELSAGGAAAGAYHPALGELVYSRMYYNSTAALLRGVAPGSEVTVTVAKGRKSMMTGAHRENLRKLLSDFSLKSIKVVEQTVEPAEEPAVKTAAHAPLLIDRRT